MYAARPGLRLWKADVRGTVQATFILKDLFAHGVRQFELFPRAGAGGTGGYRPPERQLGQVACFLREGWLLSWNEYSVYLVDSVSQVWSVTPQTQRELRRVHIILSESLISPGLTKRLVVAGIAWYDFSKTLFKKHWCKSKTSESTCLC